MRGLHHWQTFAETLMSLPQLGQRWRPSLSGPCTRGNLLCAGGPVYRGQRGMPDRPHVRPTPIRTTRLPSAVGPRDAARAVAEIRAARKSIDVREGTASRSP
jgi:hypothetical protein